MIAKKLAIFGVALAALVALAEPAIASADPGRGLERRSKTPVVYWGAHVGDLYGLDSEAPWNMGNTRAFELNTLKGLSLIEFALKWARCSAKGCPYIPFPTEQLEAIRQHGAIPVLGWASHGNWNRTHQRRFQLKDITAGRHDAYIRSWARSAAEWGKPFFLRFNWEMNLGGIFAYNEDTNGNRAGDYVRAWRHVHRIFRREGARNVTWVWCANAEYDGSIKPLRSLYPGDAFVDWTCVDAYNWGLNPLQPSGWMSFDEVFSTTYRRITRWIAPSKPFLIGETGSTEIGGEKARWIRDMLRVQLRTRKYASHVRGFIWFNRLDRGELDWPIETSHAATVAFRRGIKIPYYTRSTYGVLDASPIPPPVPVEPRRCGPKCKERWSTRS